MPQNEPLLAADDIQGNILPGFRRAQQRLVGFSGIDPAALKAALAVITPALTPLAQALDAKDERKLAFLKGVQPQRRADIWLNYALGARATDALGLPQLKDAELAFAAGMIPSRTGDSYKATLPDGSPNPGAPPNWRVGGPNHPLDMLLIFADDASIMTDSQPIVDQVAACGLTMIYSEVGHLLPGDDEHFGFQDGISQPDVIGVIEKGGAQRYLTTRYGVPDSNGVAFGKPGQPLIEVAPLVRTDFPLR